MQTRRIAAYGCAVILATTTYGRAQCELSADPTLTDTTRRGFGDQIAIGGEWLVVQGSRSTPPPFHGSLSVYRRMGDDWVFDTIIELGAFADGAFFGNSLDVFGNRIIVGVRYSGSGPYAVRIYRRDASGWVLEQEITESATGFARDAVAMGDDFAFVSTRAVGNGAVVVFGYGRNGTTWELESEFICTGGDINNGPYRPLAYDDGVLVVGDHSNCNIELSGSLSARTFAPSPRMTSSDALPGSNGGAAAALGCTGSWNYNKVFRRMADTWVSEGTLPGDPLFCDGIEVAVHGDVIAIMAEHFQNTGFDVMIFRPGLAGWDAVGQVTPSLQQAHLSAFPLALDVNGGHVAVGFHAVDHPVTDMGAAFLIEEVNGTWQETARFIANNPATSDGFGRAVAISGDKLYVGAPGRDPDAVIGAGAVYVYDISDCDGDGSPDECPGGCDDPQACGDCNNNGTRDGCDVDCDNNGTPDDCECVPLLLQANIVAPCCKNRFLEVVLPDSCQRAAMRVKMVSLHHPSPPGSNPAPDFSAFEFGPGCIEGPGGCVRWAGPPGAYIESAGTSIWFGAAMLQCQPQYHQWGDMTMTLTGAEIAPSSVYEVQFLDEGCDPSVESNYTSPQTIETDRWGDVEFPYQDPSASDPDQPNVLDLAAIVDKVKNLPLTIPRVKAELSPQLINLNLPANAVDIGAGVDSVKGAAYPFAGPSVCP